MQRPNLNPSVETEPHAPDDPAASPAWRRAAGGLFRTGRLLGTRLGTRPLPARRRAGQRGAGRRAAGLLFRGGRLVVKRLFARPLAARRRAGLRVDDGSTRLSRIIRAIAYRLAFAPILVTLLASALVYSGTHPRAFPPEVDP